MLTSTPGHACYNQLTSSHGCCAKILLQGPFAFPTAPEGPKSRVCTQAHAAEDTVGPKSETRKRESFPQRPSAERGGAEPSLRTCLQAATAPSGRNRPHAQAQRDALALLWLWAPQRQALACLAAAPGPSLLSTRLAAAPGPSASSAAHPHLLPHYSHSTAEAVVRRPQPHVNGPRRVATTGRGDCDRKLRHRALRAWHCGRRASC